MLDKFPLKITDFKGINIPDEENSELKVFPTTGMDNVPEFNDAIEGQNIRFLKSGGFRTRKYGVPYDISPADIIASFAANEILVNVFQLQELSGIAHNNRFLYLTYDGTNGKIYDSGLAVGSNIILTIAGMSNAFFINAFGRVYISPWSSYGSPTPSEYVYVYTGVGFTPVARRAQGAALDRTAATATAVANSATAGNITPGTHLFDVVYETDTGFITSMYKANALIPGGPPEIQPLTLVCNGNQVTLTDIKTGAAGSGIVRRHIIMSKLVTNYNNTGWLGYEAFFAYTINDNTTTTVTFDKPDAGLVESADYLLDATEGFIRSCSTISLYNSRLCFYRIDPKSDIPEAGHVVLVSALGDPERVDSYGTDGSRLLIGRDFSSTKVTCGFEFRGLNYVCKDRSTHVFREDLDKSPGEWPVDLVDSNNGAFINGVARVSNTPSHIIDEITIIAGQGGLFSFDGIYSKIPISMGWWNSITYADRKFTQIFIDGDRKLIYVIIGDPTYPRAGTSVKSLFVGDFNRGINYGDIKWSKDVYTLNAAYTISSEFDFQSIAGKFLLTFSSVGTLPYAVPTFFLMCRNPSTYDTFYGIREALITADTPRAYEIPYETIYTSGFSPTDIGGINTFNGIRLRLLSAGFLSGGGSATPISSSGNGSVNLHYNILDGVSPISFGESVSPGTAPGKYIFSGFNAVSEKVKIRISTLGVNSAVVAENTFTALELHELVLFLAERSKTRAQ